MSALYRNGGPIRSGLHGEFSAFHDGSEGWSLDREVLDLLDLGLHCNGAKVLLYRGERLTAGRFVEDLDLSIGPDIDRLFPARQLDLSAAQGSDNMTVRDDIAAL